MKIQKLTQDQLSIFFADAIKRIDRYNFDTLYDISTIIADFRQARIKKDFHSRDPKTKIYIFGLRDTGSDLYDPNNITDPTVKEIYDGRNSELYKIELVYNHDYCYLNKPFATITKLK